VLGSHTVIHTNYSSEEIRLTNDAFAYFCPSNTYFGGDIDKVLVRPQLRILEPLQIMNIVFEAQNWNVQLSDKGSYHIECLKRFGSLDTLSAFLKEPRHRALMDCYFDESPSSSETGVFLRDRRYLNFNAAKALLGDENDTGELLSDLVAREILYRGLILFCETCRNSDWYRIDDIGHTFGCSRCQKTQVYTKRHWKSPNEPSWYYKLDEVFYQGYRNGMTVPILTLSYLKSRSISSFLYCPELDVRTNAIARKPDLELDLCCICDGSMVIGQATKQDTLGSKEKARLESNRDIAVGIRASLLILSTLQDAWSQRTIDTAKQVFAKTDTKLQFLTRRDLLSS
jgi:hypothetical protein